MRKLFTLFAAVLASVGLWAADPTYESSNWAADDFATVVAAHDGLTILSDKTAFSGNFSGTQYIALGGGCDMTEPTNYVGITAESIIDSVAVFWTPNGTNNTSIAWATWSDTANFNNVEVEYMDKTETYKGSKSLDAAIWQTINLTGKDAKAIILTRQLKKAKINGTTQSNFGDNQTVNVLGIKVWLQETKTVVSTEETITAITVNGDSLSAAQIALINDWHESYEILHTQAYAAAPKVVFSRHTVITYDDATTKVTDEDIEVVAEYINDEFTGEYWQATLVGSDKTFKLDMFVAASAVITYMDGETVLGRDTIAAGSKAVNYAKYEVKPLAAFGGWYNDAALTDPVDLSVQTFNADATVYGKFTKAYASSLNIEQLVLDEGKKANIDSILVARNYAFADINELDSLNDEKTARNEPYLGLKIKKEGGYIACNLRAGDVIRVKFGYVENTVLAVAGNDTLSLTPEDKAMEVLEFTAQTDSYVKLQTTTGKTVVIKQIMINENIADVILPGEGGGEEKDTDATIQSLTINGVAVTAVENVYAYEVPAGENLAQVEVVYTLNSAKASADPASGFMVDVPAAGAAANTQVITVTAENGNKAEYTVSVTRASSEAIDNTEATVKAVKVIRNGQLLIEKNGVRYNVLGTVME